MVVLSFVFSLLNMLAVTWADQGECSLPLVGCWYWVRMFCCSSRTGADQTAGWAPLSAGPSLLSALGVLWRSGKTPSRRPTARAANRPPRAGWTGRPPRTETPAEIQGHHWGSTGPPLTARSQPPYCWTRKGFYVVVSSWALFESVHPKARLITAPFRWDQRPRGIFSCVRDEESMCVPVLLFSHVLSIHTTIKHTWKKSQLNSFNSPVIRSDNQQFSVG